MDWEIERIVVYEEILNEIIVKTLQKLKEKNQNSYMIDQFGKERLEFSSIKVPFYKKFKVKESLFRVKMFSGQLFRVAIFKDFQAFNEAKLAIFNAVIDFFLNRNSL